MTQKQRPPAKADETLDRRRFLGRALLFTAASMAARAPSSAPVVATGLRDRWLFARVAGRRPARAPAAVARMDRGELLVGDAARGPVAALNHTAAAVWRACDGRRTVRQIAHAIAEAYAVPRARVENDVAHAVRTLWRHRLVSL